MRRTSSTTCGSAAAGSGSPAPPTAACTSVSRSPHRDPRALARDPAITVGSTGGVYLSFMHQAHHQKYPVVDASFNHGVSFPQVSSLRPPKAGNWGDRDFIAVNKKGWVYVTWDYGPSAAMVKLLCSTGSCAYKAGDLNAVVQKFDQRRQDIRADHPDRAELPEQRRIQCPGPGRPKWPGRRAVLGPPRQQPNTYALQPGHEYFSSTRPTVAPTGQATPRQALPRRRVHRAADLVDRWGPGQRPRRQPVRDVGHPDFGGRHRLAGLSPATTGRPGQPRCG